MDDSLKKYIRRDQLKPICEINSNDREILEIFSELHSTKVGDDELSHILNCYRCDLDYSRDQVDEMALRYTWGELTGCHRTIADDLAGIETVSTESLRQTARELFTPANLRGAIVGPYRTRDRKSVEKIIADWQIATND